MSIKKIKIQKLVALFLAVVMLIGVSQLSIFLGLEAEAASGSSSSVNYSKLRTYINNYGTTNSDGNKSILYSDYSDGTTFYYYLENTYSGIRCELLTSSTASTRFGSLLEFVITDTSKYITADYMLLYYRYNTYTDGVDGSKKIDRSTYSTDDEFYLYNSGTYITSEAFSGMFNASMALLTKYVDIFTYSKLGFGLKGLGFINYDGYGYAVCDKPSSYHTGSTTIQNKVEATCVKDGYTGDTYCATCNEKLSSGKTIASVGHHTYTNSCDEYCNVCNEVRTVAHSYSNKCDSECDICGALRTASEHIYDNACDTTCNECDAERTVADHIYDNNCDTTCNECGAVRTAKAHIYDDNCDASCNECNAVRTAPHLYDSESDRNCSICGYERQLCVSGHKYQSEITTEASCTEKGVKTYTCKVCSNTYTEDISATGHSSSDWIISKEATVTEDGLKYKECTVCKVVLEETTIPHINIKDNFKIEIEDNKELTYKAVIKPNVEITALDGIDYTVSFVSSNENVATVDEDGNITATGIGEAEITVTVTDEYGNVVEDTCKVTVSYSWWQWLIVIFLFGWIWY